MSTIANFPIQGTIGASRKPKRYDIEIYQGDTFEVKFIFRDAANALIDLTGTTYATKFVGIDAAPDPATQPVVSAPSPLTGEVVFVIADTTSLSGTYNWDLQLIKGGAKRTYIGGLVTVTDDITP